MNHSRTSDSSKGGFRIWFLVPVLTAGLAVNQASRVTAQTFTTLHNGGGSLSVLSGKTLYGDFWNGSQGQMFALNTEGSGGLRILHTLPTSFYIAFDVSNILYGTTGSTSSDSGSVFALNTDGTGFRTLHSFTHLDTSSPPPYTNSDGAFPSVSILSGNTLYGTTPQGGNGGQGTIFAVNTDGTGFALLHSFAPIVPGAGFPPINSDGVSAWVSALSGNTLYGTTPYGGSAGDGTVFAVNADGTGFMTLYSFSGGDGADPGNLILAGNTLYGCCLGGLGTGGVGTVFAVNTDGTGFAVLHNFTTPQPSSFTDNYGNTAYTNSDGIYPWDLILSGNTLYGTTSGGGSGGNGTVFSVNTDGTGFAVLYSFTPVWPSALTNSLVGNVYTNSDGAFPEDLILSGNKLYGAAPKGGSGGDGTVFVVNADGTGFTNLHNFPPLLDGLINMYGNPVTTNSDGAFPGISFLSGNTLYGGTGYGGPSGNGTLFSISLGPIYAPQLAIIPAGINVILAWPTNATAFALQSTTNLGPSAVWTTNSLPPVVINGQNTVTNPISSRQQFFRLAQ